MNKILVCLTLAVFATVTSLQAADSSAKDKAACTDGQSCCSAAKTTSTTSNTSTGKCCTAGKVAKKNGDLKGAVVLVQK